MYPQLMQSYIAIDTAPLIARGLYVTGQVIDWDKVPGKHTLHLLRSLAKHQLSGIDWVFSDGVEIEKTEDNIVFSLGENELAIRLKDDLSRVVVTVDDGRTCEFPVRAKDGKVGIYGLNRFKPPDAALPEKQMNRLLYWGDLRLLDYIENPRTRDSCQEELLRNITLSISFGKLVKRYSDAIVTIPNSFRKVLLGKIVAARYKDDFKEETIEESDHWIIRRTTRVNHLGTLKLAATDQTVTMMEVFKMYLESSLSSQSMLLDDISMIFRLTPPGTNYQISFLLSGKIRRIKVVLPDGRAPTVDEIIGMSDWANRELAGIVEKAAICKKVEQSYDPDEPESEITEVCDI